MTAETEPRFRERQSLTQWWILLTVAVIAAIAWYFFVDRILVGGPAHDPADPERKPAPELLIWIVWAISGLILPLIVFAGHMTVTVDRQSLRIRWVPFASTTIAIHSIESATPSTYRPIRDYLGWGIRWTKWKGWAWNVSGNRGVQLVLEGGKRVLIGSRRPEELAAAIGRPPAEENR